MSKRIRLESSQEDKKETEIEVENTLNNYSFTLYRVATISDVFTDYAESEKEFIDKFHAYLSSTKFRSLSLDSKIGNDGITHFKHAMENKVFITQLSINECNHFTYRLRLRLIHVNPKTHERIVHTTSTSGILGACSDWNEETIKTKFVNAYTDGVFRHQTVFLPFIKDYVMRHVTCDLTDFKLIS